MLITFQIKPTIEHDLSKVANPVADLADKMDNVKIGMVTMKLMKGDSIHNCFPGENRQTPSSGIKWTT